jgi:hypothetical protein
MSNPRTRSAQIAADQAMIAGVQKLLTQYPSLHVGSQIMTPAQIVQTLQNRIQAMQAAQVADAARMAAVKAVTDELDQTAGFEQSLRSVVQGMFSQSPDSLAVFGLKPRKIPTESAETRAAAVVKALATRKARGTLGPKAKLKVTGQTVPAATSGTAPATPATPTKPTA